MSIGKLAAGPAAGAYYEQAVASGREDYYADEGERAGRCSARARPRCSSPER
jgi:hypothetical protein